jgi:hypothetical protein
MKIKIRIAEEVLTGDTTPTYFLDYYDKKYGGYKNYSSSKDMNKINKDCKQIQTIPADLHKRVDTVLKWCQENIDHQTGITPFAIQVRDCLEGAVTTSDGDQ